MEKLKHKAQVILNALDCPESELSILIVDDPQIATLNQDYLDRSGPTNVIAFPMQEGAFADVAPLLLGDVVISADTAKREGADAGIDFEARLYDLLIHGILHLVGYDHEKSEAEAQRMEGQTQKLSALIR